jgi:hypothetical protein
VRWALKTRFEEVPNQHLPNEHLRAPVQRPSARRLNEQVKDHSARQNIAWNSLPADSRRRYLEHLRESGQTEAFRQAIADLSSENLGDLLETLPSSLWQARWQQDSRKHFSEAMVLFAALVSLIGFQAIGLVSPPLVFGGMFGVLAVTSFIWAGESIVVSVGRSLMVSAMVSGVVLAAMVVLFLLGSLLTGC